MSGRKNTPFFDPRSMNDMNDRYYGGI